MAARTAHPPTLADVAAHLGVSRTTVSNAYNRPDQLSPALRERVLDAARQLGYNGPDPMARSLRRGRAGSLGLVFDHRLQYIFNDPAAVLFLSGVAAGCEEQGTGLALVPQLPEGAAEVVRSALVDGYVMFCTPENDERLDAVRARGLPYVLVDFSPYVEGPRVNIDDRGGARAGAQHVLDLGHRHVGIISSSVIGPFGQLSAVEMAGLSNTTRARLDGWLDVLLPAGVTPTIFQQRPYNADEIAVAARELLALPERPTAVLCFSDEIAAIVIRTAQHAGLKVPQDLSVVGFDDSPVATRMEPALTTIRQDVIAKGRAAVDALTAELKRRATKDDAASPAEVLLPTQLVIRDSTASR
jgi:DNA-binding LacI/PurR family transcriptional regulator